MFQGRFLGGGHPGASAVREEINASDTDNVLQDKTKEFAQIARGIIKDIKDGKIGKALAQIGKGLEVITIFERNSKKIAEAVDTATRKTLGKIELTDKLDSQILIQTLSSLMKNINASYQPILEEFLALLQTSPPIEFYTYSKLIRNLFGFARRQNNLIALHKALSTNPLAIFHEISEYLAQSKALNLRLEDNKLIISINKTDKFTLPLSDEALKIARKGEAADQHYLLRALQREIFGVKDRELTEKIEARQKAIFKEVNVKTPGFLSKEIWLNITVRRILKTISKGKNVVLTGTNSLEEIKEVYYEVARRNPDILGKICI
jgi:hypothetical protein